MILAIDTATEQASVALVHDDVLGEISWLPGGNHSRHLVDVIRHLVTLTGVAIQSVERIAVASGPGSFSGLRVGVSTAKGLAMGLGVPLTGIPTLDIIGFQASQASPSVWALIPAGRSEMYLGRFAGQGDDWARVGDFERLPIDRVLADYRSGILLAGPGVDLVASRLANRGVSVSLESPARRVRRSAFLAELGMRYFNAGGQDQRETLELTYLRRSSAEERRQAAEGTG